MCGKHAITDEVARTKQYLSPDTVEEAEIDDWHFTYSKEQVEVLPSGTVIDRMSTRRAGATFEKVDKT